MLTQFVAVVLRRVLCILPDIYIYKSAHVGIILKVLVSVVLALLTQLFAIFSHTQSIAMDYRQDLRVTLNLFIYQKQPKISFVAVS